MESTKACQGCTQQIHTDATRCPHCQARQASAMHRGHPGKMIGGVCTALAQQLSVDVAIVRVGFALALAVSGGMAFGIYVLFWMLTPPVPGAEAPAARWADAVTRWGSATPSGQPVPEPTDIGRPSSL